MRLKQLARLCPQAVRLYLTPDRITSPYREVAILTFVPSALPSPKELTNSDEQIMGSAAIHLHPDFQ
ncbi:MAG TPA: hypothetical protein VNO75_01140 [Gemmatimonadaceae bacterium]|nr:hypothetical protein [Gemmatimonadaceae bacterium]